MDDPGGDAHRPGRGNRCPARRFGIPDASASGSAHRFDGEGLSRLAAPRGFCPLAVMSRALVVSSVALALALTVIGCGPSSKSPTSVTEKVQQEVAAILKKDSAQIDVRTPLGAQGADELDVVEIVMAVEEAFSVEIPDSALGEKPDEIAKTLTVQKLADLVIRQMEKRKR